MFSDLRRLVGSIDVQERGDQIHISGLPANLIEGDIMKIWSTSKIAANMFTSIGRSHLSFNKFFAPDVAYTLDTINNRRDGMRNYKALGKILELLHEHTWLRDTLEPPTTNRLDFKQLDRLTVTMLPRQLDFLEMYNQLVPQHDLKGYLLGAPPGTGKTLAGIGLSVCLNADVTIGVVPKNSVDEVWDKTIATRFKKPQRYWTSTSNRELKAGYDYYIFHYEQLERALEFFKSIRKHRVYQNPCILLDESHNFNEILATRTQLFIELCALLECQNVL